MKLMKHITIALVLCAIPAVAVGQTVDCEVCSHRVSVYHGEGGLIATVGDGAEMVTWVASCGGVTRTGELMPNADGVVSMLLTGDTACMMEGGSFRLGPITDGGWYWLTMENNSAVGGLVNDMILDNTPTEITDAGDGVTMVDGSGAVLLTETATGRVGLLPNILPEKPAAAATMCGAYRKADKSIAQTTAGCMMGDGSTMTRISYAGGFGRTDHAVGSATVYRSITDPGSVTLDLWTTGGMVTTADATTIAVGTGYSGLGVGLAIGSVSATVSGFGATLDAALGTANATLSVTDGNPGADPPTSDQVTITFEGATASTYCTATSSNDAVLTVNLVSDQTNVLPAVKNIGSATAPRHGQATVTIKCPPPAANLGTELVPDNPFPTSE